MDIKNKKSLPSKTKELTFNIGENPIELTVSFPKTGEIIDIENNKKFIANGNYKGFDTTSSSSMFAKLSIDAICTFEVLLPDLLKKFNVDSFYKLELFDTKQIVKTYSKQFLPWYTEWMNIISNFEEDEE